jgi:plastocyanin
MKKMALALVAALSLGVLAGCGSSGTAGGSGPTLEVMAGENNAMAYNPTTLKAKVGDTVKVHLVNKDTSTAHTFVLPDFNAQTKQVQPGKDETISFKVDKAGDFKYHCNIPGHEATMTGTLTVTP